MGRRFNEQHLWHGRKYPPEDPVYGGVRTVAVSSENIVNRRCPLCAGEYFRKMTGAGEQLAFVDLMSCRGCGWLMPNEKIPAFVKENARLRPCAECGCACFEENYAVYSVSRIIIGAREDKILMRQALFCGRCGARFETEPAMNGKLEDGGCDGK